MPEQSIENYITEVLAGDTKANALNFVSFLRNNKMEFERDSGYWEKKLYWYVKYKNEYVCFIFMTAVNEEHAPWTVWSDDSGYNCFETSAIDNNMKEIAWQHVDACKNCGSCKGGTHKTIFGKEFDNVCGTTFSFTNPDVETLKCIKEILAIRKENI